MYKAQKTIYGAIKGEIIPGRPAIIHRNDQVPGLDWQRRNTYDRPPL